jgi:hypothetical protein
VPDKRGYRTCEVLVRDLSGVSLPLLPIAGSKAIYQQLGVGSTRVGGTVPPCLENEKKQGSQRQAANYGNNACDNRMPLDAAEREIDHGADWKEN